MSASHEIVVPKAALVMAGVLVASVLTLAATWRIAEIDPIASPTIERAAGAVAVVSQRELSFTDRADGGVVIADPSGPVTVLEPGGQDGFIRGVLRAFARDRRIRDLDNSGSFTLTLWKDGSLSLLDNATGRSFDLGGFGATNRAAFIALLEAGQ